METNGDDCDGLDLVAYRLLIDFGFLKETLGLTDGNLSRHLSVLEDAGYVKISKGYQGKRPHTSVTATKSGRKALAGHLASLRELIGQVDRASTKGDDT